MRCSPPSPLVSVLMPTFKQASFLPRALESLLAQSWEDWELIVVDDGSPDDTARVIQPYLADPRISFHRLERNGGLGAALNHATALARGRYLAYLPSDDVYYREHLEQLVGVLEAHPPVDLAYGGVRWDYKLYGPTLRGKAAVGREAEFLGLPPEDKSQPTSGNLLALVQVMHRRREGLPRWTERAERVSDTLEVDFWRALLDGGARFAYAGAITCEWVGHPDQRHQIIAGIPGGLSRYRAHYGIGRGEYLNFQPSRGMRVNEWERYGRFAPADHAPRPDGLKILLVGSLGFNPERMLALEERGHKLYGLWSPDPETWDATGPFSYGHIEDIPLDECWPERVRAVRPDVIYALLNLQALPLIERVLDARLGIPFVFHFKEGPFPGDGLWPALIRVLKESDSLIFISPENREWYRLALGGQLDESRTFILDGDLPKIDWMTDEWSPKLSQGDGQIHTVCAGRPLGLEPLSELARQGIHVHFYGTHFHEWFPNWTRSGLESGFLHLHPTVEPQDWVRELSRYDAAWVQQFDSVNGGDLRRATWDDLNLPARLGTYAAAGLPWIMRDNRHSLVAMQTLAQDHDFGVFYRDFADLAAQLRDRPRLEELTANARAARRLFAFDTHAADLVDFFRRVLAAQAFLQDERVAQGDD
ncbi:glycosyltransferase [Deinococcus aluminii]